MNVCIYSWCRVSVLLAGIIRHTSAAPKHQIQCQGQTSALPKSACKVSCPSYASPHRYKSTRLMSKATAFWWENEWSERSYFSHIACTSNESVGVQKNTGESSRSVQLIKVSFCSYYLPGKSLLAGVSTRNGISQQSKCYGLQTWISLLLKDFICITCPGYIVHLYRTVDQHIWYNIHTCTYQLGCD